MPDLKSFFEPKSIAIIGASNHSEKVGGILMKKILASNNIDKIIPINPKHAGEKIFGIKCYGSILDYKEKEKIDLAVIAVPAEFVSSAIEECGKKEIKNMIIISAGFSEVGNKDEEKKIVEIAKKFGIRILGPNCFGICNPTINLDLTFSLAMPDSGDIGFVSQSGALWSYIADLSIGKFGFSKFASLGNMSDLEFSDFIEYFSEDKRTKNIVLYIEKLKDGRRFIDVCRRCIEAGKKIYAVKAGSSKEGEKAAVSHTGSLASEYEIYKGAFKQAGVELCSGLEEAFSIASGKNPLQNKDNKKVKTKKISLKKGEEVKIITNAGGAGVLASDYLAEKSIRVIENKDLIGTALASDYLNELNKTIEENTKERNVKNIIIILTAQNMTEIEKTASAVCDFALKNKDRKIIAIFLGGESMMGANKIFEKNKIDCFNDFESFRRSL